jgi:hypothetical protein
MAMSGNFRLELRPRDDYLDLQALHAEEENMTHTAQGPLTFKTLEPGGEVAVVQRPEGTIKLVFYTCSGEQKTCHSEITLDHQNAFQFAMAILQQAYRLGQGLG